jgi:predicted nuclease of predicted toxin-antitoxin system
MRRFILLNKPFMFLIDECVGLTTINFLRELGYPLITVEEAEFDGKSDFEILNLAIRKKCVLITEDIEFGNILLYPPKTHHGIILLRFRHNSEHEIHNVL